MRKLTLFRLLYCERPFGRPSLSITILLLPMFLSVAGCERYGAAYPTEADGQYLVVHGMLGGGTQEQEIIIEYSRAIDEGYYRGLTPASRAQVAVAGEDTYPFFEAPDRPGVYQGSFVPRPGERYVLHVRGPAGETLTAETVVPGSPRIRLPSTDTTVTRGSDITLSWARGVEAAAYAIIDQPPNHPGSLRNLLYPGIVHDTSINMQLGLLGGDVFHIRIAAVDTNYLQYVQGTPTELGERNRIRSTVKGGYGLFGSYALSDSRLISLR